MWDLNFKQITIIAALVIVVGLPFFFRIAPEHTAWAPGDPVLIIISPHNEAIRHEFGRAFSAWHTVHYGSPVKIDWRVIGGTSDIIRYIEGAMLQSFRAWWGAQGGQWPAGAQEMVFDLRFDPAQADQTQRTIWEAMRATDDPGAVSCGIDLLFGGGTYDHDIVARKGLTVMPWPPDEVPEGLFYDEQGRELIPRTLSGEIWRNDYFIGVCLSTFGICYNPDRVAGLGLQPPARWSDLADIRYAGLLGVADPTKSGSIAKAFEMLIHEQCHAAVRAAGFSLDDSRRFEALPAALPSGAVWPEELPLQYRQALEQGWLNGLFLVQKIGANARYFTDGAGQVPMDVSMGNAAAGIAIDFYGRFQSEFSQLRDGSRTLKYITPLGGSSVSADPISLLRGAPSRELALRFISFVLSTEGQALWTYRPGTPGGPERYALRRLPIRRDFYPQSWPDAEAVRHLEYAGDPLDDRLVDPYAIAAEFEYFPRWTARHFAVHRDLIRAMCIDSGNELRALWAAVQRAGGPEKCAEVMAYIEVMPDVPEPVNWSTVRDITRRYERLEYMNAWTQFYRDRYRVAREMLQGRP